MQFKIESKFLKSRDAYFAKVCANKKVLHIGACDAPYTLEKHRQGLLLHEKLHMVSSEVVGIDNDEKAVGIMSDLGYNDVICFDMNKVNELDFVPQVIVFGETIEHLMNIEVAISNIKKVMSEDCQLLISTPNAFCLFNFLRAIIKREATHEDHKHYFSPQTLKQLLEANGLKTEVVFTFLDRKGESYKKKVLKAVIRCFPMLCETLVFRCELM